jgi:uroporphyrinogen decarboxylase
VSPAIWRRLIRSQLARLVAHYQAAGIPVILHTCGNVTAIMDDLVELGLAAFNLQTNANDLVALRARYGPRFCVWGGISTQSVLGCGTPGQVRAAVRHTIERLGADGGLILEPDHWVTVPPDNLDAYFDEARRCQP